MTLLVRAPAALERPERPVRPGRSGRSVGRARDRLRAARDERSRLARQDRLSARLAELHRIDAVLADATELVGRGWVQHGWFAYLDDGGATRVATAHDLRRMAGRPVVGACLVGGVVQGGGGLPAARSQVVGRTLDLTWSVLCDSGGDQSRRTPSAAERALQVCALTSWNDAPQRRVEEVTGLLAATRHAAAAEAGRLRTVVG